MLIGELGVLQKKFGIVGRGAIYDKKSARFLYERYSKTPLVHETFRELFHDKYDLKNSDLILRKIREDKFYIKWIDVNEFSKLAEPILDHTAKYYSAPANLDQGILDLVKKRLEKNKTSINLCTMWKMGTCYRNKRSKNNSHMSVL